MTDTRERLTSDQLLADLKTHLADMERFASEAIEAGRAEPPLPDAMGPASEHFFQIIRRLGSGQCAVISLRYLREIIRQLEFPQPLSVDAAAREIGPKHLARCHREATRDVIFLFQRRRLRWTGHLPECCEFDGENSCVWLKGADREKSNPVTLDWLLSEHGSEYVSDTWDVEGVWLDRDEATAWGNARHYNYRDGWRVYGMPAEGELAGMLKTWEASKHFTPQPEGREGA